LRILAGLLVDIIFSAISQCELCRIGQCQAGAIVDLGPDRVDAAFQYTIPWEQRIDVFVFLVELRCPVDQQITVDQRISGRIPGELARELIAFGHAIHETVFLAAALAGALRIVGVYPVILVCDPRSRQLEIGRKFGRGLKQTGPDVILIRQRRQRRAARRCRTIAKLDISGIPVCETGDHVEAPVLAAGKSGACEDDFVLGAPIACLQLHAFRFARIKEIGCIDGRQSNNATQRAGTIKR
jgi:hypothetical protein